MLRNYESFSILIKFDAKQGDGEETRLFHFGTHSARQAFVKFISWAIGQGYDLQLSKVSAEEQANAGNHSNIGIRKTVGHSGSGFIVDDMEDGTMTFSSNKVSKTGVQKTLARSIPFPPEEEPLY